MRGLFTGVDSFLVERLFQPMLEVLHARLGINRSAAACSCINLAAAGWILARAGALTTPHEDALSICGSFVLLLLGLTALLGLRSLFRRQRDAGRRNPLRLTMLPHRAVILLMILSYAVQGQQGQLRNIADIGALCATAAALYLGACATPPPARRSLPAFSGTATGSA